MSEWISVKDRLPEKSGYIMVSNGCLPFIAMYYQDTGNINSEDETYRLRDIGYWQPVPEPPTKILNKG